MNQDSIWRDEETGLPIHTHAYEEGGFVKTIKPKPCDCGQLIFDISKSAGELVKKHESIKRLKELGWHDVTEREMEKMKGEDPDNSGILYKAFESMDGIRYCYSEQEVVDFLEQLEAHIS
jgi:hypothetical protein